MLKATSAAILLLSLIGCSYPQITAEKAPSTDNQFILNQSITIYPGSARAFIQNGALIRKSLFNRAEQHCRIEVHQIQETKTTIEADTFNIVTVSIDEEMIARNFNKDGGLLLASNKYLAVTSDTENIEQLQLAENYLPPPTMDLIHLQLASNIQPNVFRLTCAGSLSDGDPQDAPWSYRPDLTAINNVLGNIAKIE